MTDFNGKRTNRIEIFVSPELELAMRRRAEADERSLSQFVCRILIYAEEMMEQEDARAQQISHPLTLAKRQPNPFLPANDGEERMA